MARGNWRNWEEVECPGCGKSVLISKKYMKRMRKCLACGEKLGEKLRKKGK